MKVASPSKVAVTGVGAVSGWGWSAPALWRGLLSGRPAIRAPQRFDTTGHRTLLASEVPEPPPELVASVPGWHRLTWADRYALAAAAEACRQAGLEPPFEGIGVFFGGSTAGMAEGEEYFRILLGEGSDRLHLQDIASHQMNGPGDEVARRFRATGPVYTVSSACAAGGLALGAALDALRAGEVEVALAGGADSLCQLTYGGFNSLRAVDEEVCRPFRESRAGLSLGEGGAVLVLEPLERALARGVRPLALLEGAGASCDAHHMTAPHPEGSGAALAMEAALQDAGLAPEAIHFINAHGTGTPLNDVAEGKALHSVFGERAACLPVTSTKASVGHLLGSSGALEAVATVLCLEEGRVHPVPGAEGRHGVLEGVDLVLGEPRSLEGGEARPPRALSTSFAFGGSNAAVLLAAAAAERSPEGAP